MSILSNKTIEIAIGELGKQEVPRGSNAGKDVEKYLKSVGLGGGYSWCMAFVYWCVDQARIELEKTNPIVKTAGVLDQWRRISPERKKTTPQVGDIFIMDFGKGKGHTGFVTKIDGVNVHTIEGNTNDEGSREGYEVSRRVRSIKSIKGFIRI